ncbi:ATP-dependent Clp protease adaptor ClpS [bacterium]|nr:ATP-dependent Clp protease adaptor ClpS [bacterium]
MKSVLEMISPVVDEHTKTEKSPSDSTTLDSPMRVILFNDDVHTFDEVIGQLIKATGCTSAKAEALAWEVHTTGKAVCYEGELSECLRVSGVLEEIGLHTQIEP